MCSQIGGHAAVHSRPVKTHIGDQTNQNHGDIWSYCPVQQNRFKAKPHQILKFYCNAKPCYYSCTNQYLHKAPDQIMCMVVWFGCSSVSDLRIARIQAPNGIKRRGHLTRWIYRFYARFRSDTQPSHLSALGTSSRSTVACDPDAAFVSSPRIKLGIFYM